MLVKISFIILSIVFISNLSWGDVDLQNLQIPDVDIDDFTAIKEKCDKAGGPGTYEKLKASKDSLQTCITKFANVTAVQNEVEEAKKTGSMDEVFAKYCSKRQELATCVEGFNNNLRACLNSEENKALNKTIDVLKQLGDFICYRDGDRIAMFIAEGGVECIQSRTEGIKNCVNSTFKIEPNTVNTNNLPSFLMDQKKCDDLGKLQNCVVGELERCSQSTPANIVDALFKFIKRSACGKKNKRSVKIHNIMKRSAALADKFFYDSPEMKNNFLNIFKEKCERNAADGGYEAFTLTLESAAHCIRNKTRQESIFVTPVTNFKENVQRCVRKLVEKTEACLEDEEKYWPQFYLDTILNIIDFLYKYKNTLLNLKRVELINCFQNLKQVKAQKELLKCLEVPEVKSLEKEIICEKLTKSTECISKQINKTCIPDVDVNKIVAELIQAIISPCYKENQ